MDNAILNSTNITINNYVTNNNYNEQKNKKCTICKETKPIENFSKNHTRKDGYGSQCKMCERERKRKYYANPVNAQNEKERTRVRCNKASKALQIIRIASDPCEKCGCTDPNVLTLDHIEPTKKKRKKNGNKIQNISHLGTANQIFLEFLGGNTRVLCYRCHFAHTTTQRNRTSDKSRLEKRDYVNKKKKEIGKCLHCGFCDLMDPSVFHFDHINPATKTASIANMVHSCNKQKFYEKIDAEIAKCQLLCANCHLIRTRHQQGTYMTFEYIDELKKDVIQGKYDYLSLQITQIKEILNKPRIH